MTAQKETVVTPERLDQGITWDDWMQKIERNKDKFAENYEATTLNPDDVAKIKDLISATGGDIKVLALAEPWCTDVVRGLPVMARLAEATGLDLKIFFRDENMDIMNEYLYKGEFQSIPTFVFYTEEHKNLGHWIEKAKKAREEMHLVGEITTKMRDPELSQEERDKYMAEYNAFQQGPVWDGWRQAEVTEIRELLESGIR